MIGCLVYLYIHIFSKTDFDGIVEEAKGILDNDYEVQKLEKEIKFSDTISNRLKLADLYTEKGNYSKAIDQYKSCLTGNTTNDPGIKMGLLRAYYLNGQYQKAIAIGEHLEEYKPFHQSEQRVAYAWALYNNNEIDKAQANFAAMDNNFTNYPHRLEYAKFLVAIQKKMSAEVKLEELLEEFDHMHKQEKRNKRNIIRDVQNYYESIK